MKPEIPYIEDPKQEARYRALENLGQKLKIPIPSMFLQIEVFDGQGRLIHGHKQRSHSWTRNAYNCMFSQLAGKDADDATFEAGKLSAKNTAGVIKSGNGAMGQHTYNQSIDDFTYGYRGPAGDATIGILVGSGLNAESFEDYVLQTQIAEGAGAGQLNHAAGEAHAISYAAPVFKNERVRYFNNNSGGNIDVNEVGLVGSMWITLNCKMLQCRDKLGATVTVPNTGQLKVTYTIQLTYPV